MAQAQQQTNVVEFDSARVEKLVALKAEKAALEKQIKELETYFKSSGASEFDSESHVVKITPVTTNRTDYKTIAEKQGISDYMRKKYTKATESVRLTVSVRK